MYRKAKAMRRTTATAAITPPAIAAVLVLLAAPGVELSGEELEVWEAANALEEDGDVKSSKEYEMESRIISEGPLPTAPFFISRVWFASVIGPDEKTVTGWKVEDPEGL